MNNPPSYKGFTLIEVMVALAIAAIGLLAISKSLATSVDIESKLESRMIANWVSSNKMAELRLNRFFSSGGTDISYEKMAGRKWKVVENYITTADPNIIRVVIEVFEDGKDEAIVQNTGFLGRYKPSTL